MSIRSIIEQWLKKKIICEIQKLWLKDRTLLKIKIKIYLYFYKIIKKDNIFLNLILCCFIINLIFVILY
jgi:hypothetical protein